MLEKSFFFLKGNHSSSSSPTGNSPTKGHSNPYARPLSAKDIVSDLQNQQKIKKSQSGTQQAPNGVYSKSGSGTPMFGFPMNAFMRPQSALRKDSVKTGENNKTVTKEAFTKNGITKTTPRKHIPPTRLEREQDLSETVLLQTDINANQTKKVFGPSQQDVNPEVNGKIDKQTNGNTSSQSKTTVGSQTQNSAVAKANGAFPNGVKLSSASDNNGNNKTLAFAKPVSSLPRPGSAVASRQNSESPSKVRNLNYTPTKPYHEVSNPSGATNQTVSATTKTQLTSETTVTVKADPPKGTTYIAPSNIPLEPKYPSSNHSNNTSKQMNGTSSTTYYRKESKADVMIHEQRPPAVGAPAKPLKGAEKNSCSNLTELDEAADDESEVPSG